MKIKRVISCLLVAVFSMSLLLVQESAQAKIGTVQKILPSELHVEGRYIYNAEGEKVRLTGANIPDLQWATGGDNDLMNKARAGIPVDLEFGYELSETQKITIICHEVYLPKPKRSISGPGGIECSYDFQGAKEQTLGKMMTVILINNEEAY